MGNFPVLPISGELSESPNGMNTFDQYENILQSHAGYLSLKMADNTPAQLTVNKRLGIASFLFDSSKNNGTVLIGSGISSTEVTNAMVKITSKNSCEGFAEGGDFCGAETNYKIYFVAEFDRDSNSKGTWTKDRISKIQA